MANQYYWMLFIIAIGVAIISNLLRKIIKLLEKQNESFLDIITYLKTNKIDINENGKVKNYDGNNTKSIKYEPWICKNCGTKNPILNEICTKCGAKKDNTDNPNQEEKGNRKIDTWKCPVCGTENDTIICKKCGIER